MLEALAAPGEHALVFTLASDNDADGIAARITEVPAGTVTGSPSMTSVTISLEVRCGVP